MQSIRVLHCAQAPRADLEGQMGSTLHTVPQEQVHIPVCSALLRFPRLHALWVGTKMQKGTPSLSG